MSRFLIRNIRRRTIAIVLGVVTCAAVYSLAARTPPELPRFSEPPPELQPTAGQNMRVDLLTIDAGVEFYSVWGHTALRIYDARSGRRNQQSYGVSTGLTWNINRYLDLEADASYTRTKEPGVTDEETTRVGLGLRLRR